MASSARLLEATRRSASARLIRIVAHLLAMAATLAPNFYHLQTWSYSPNSRGICARDISTMPSRSLPSSRPRCEIFLQAVDRHVLLEQRSQILRQRRWLSLSPGAERQTGRVLVSRDIVHSIAR